MGDFSPGGLKSSFLADGLLQAGLDRLTGTELTRNSELALLDDGASLEPMLRISGYQARKNGLSWHGRRTRSLRLHLRKSARYCSVLGWN